MITQTKELSNSIICTVYKSINEMIIELLLCWKNEKKLTHNDLSSKQKKLWNLDKEYRYIREKIIDKDNIYLDDACYDGYELTVKCLVEHGADVQGNKDAFTNACKNGHETIVKYLVEHGADVQGNEEALNYACEKGHEIIVKYLVEHGADVKGNKHVLVLAYINGHDTIVKYLIEHVTDVQGN